MTYSIRLFQEIEEAKRIELEKIRTDLLDLTRQILTRMSPDIRAEEIYITGSLLVPFRFGKNSDIDIAVKGLPGEDYFPLLAHLEDLLPRTVEIIDLEDCRFKDKIIEKGLRIK